MAETRERPPVLVLGLGNALLTDDGVGLELLELLRRSGPGDDPRLELVDGGTQGIALAPLFEGRRAVLLLDAEQRGGRPGSIYVSDAVRLTGGARGATAHEGNAAELLGVVRLLGIHAGTVHLLGIEPQEVRTGHGLSPAVRRALPRASGAARAALRRLAAASAGGEREAAACTS